MHTRGAYAKLKTTMHILFSDLDGSLHDTVSGFHSDDLNLLQNIPKNDPLRVIATGRSLYSARLLLDTSFPIDYLIFSSGAGIMKWETQALIRQRHLETEDISTLFKLFEIHQLDFFLHGEVPENHLFWHHCFNAVNADFEARRLLYEGLGKPLFETLPANFSDWAPVTACSQAIVFVSEQDTLRYENLLKKALPHLNIIRSTSPLDKRSGWLEIFPGDVSKSQAAQWLKNHKKAQGSTMALGNDYNDSDLLLWADHGFIVQNAPQELRQRHIEVNNPSKGGLSQAFGLWESQWRTSHHDTSF